MKEYVIIIIIVAQTFLRNEKIKYLPGEKTLKTLSIIYADLECLLKKVQYCQNNPKNSCTEKKSKHKPSGYAYLMIQKGNTIFIG